MPAVQNAFSDASEALIESMTVPITIVLCPPATVTPFGLNAALRGVKQSVLTDPVMFRSPV